MEIIWPILQFGLGLGLLVGGAWVLVGGGTRISAVLGIPTVVVGLTVVAFGTSAPELFVSIMGAARGSTGLVLGNVIGSNVANLGLILAAAALLRPVVVEGGLVRREMPLLLGVTGLFILMVWDGVLTHIEAGVLVVVFLAFMGWTLRPGDRGGSPVVPDAGSLQPVPAGRRMRGVLGGLAMVLGGIAGLAGGGYFIVNSALEIATRMGVSETLIGLTLVAVGTSLPELATTVVAALRQEDDLALGNIVGSNLFNILAVAGPVGLFRELVDTDGAIHAQLASMGLITLMVFVMLRFGGGSLGRRRGALLLATYAVVMFFLTTQ